MNLRLSLCTLILFICALSVKAQTNIPIPLPQLNKQFQVVAYIVLKQDSVAPDDGFTPIDSVAISSALLSASSAFSPIAVSFKLCEVRYIYNFQYTDTLSDEYTKEMYNHYRAENRINIYYIDSYKEPQTCGKATLGAIAQSSTGTITIACFGSGTLTHELGHYFGLLHTFEQDDTAPELVNGSNCAVAGDLICDTPADPYVSPADASTYVVKHPMNPTLPECLFINTEKDANSQYYSPDVSNIMSYYHCGCSHFTHDQYLRMANTYLKGTMGRW